MLYKLQIRSLPVQVRQPGTFLFPVPMADCPWLQEHPFAMSYQRKTGKAYATFPKPSSIARCRMSLPSSVRLVS